jgi:hypothetical protein
MNWDSVQQLLRILLQFGGGLLVSRGILNEELATQLVGGGMSLAMVAWWIFWNNKREDPKV